MYTCMHTYCAMAQVSFCYDTRLKRSVDMATSSLWPPPKIGTWIHTGILYLCSHSRAQDCDQDGRQGPSDGFWCSEPWGRGHERHARLTPSTPEYFFIKSSVRARDCCCLPASQGEYFGLICLKNMFWRTQITTAKPPAPGGHQHSPSNPSFPAAQANLRTHQNLSACFPTAFTTGLTSLHYNLRWSHRSVICDVLKHSLHCKNSNMSLESN